MQQCIICGNELSPRDKKYCVQCREDGSVNRYACKNWYRKHRNHQIENVRKKVMEYREAWFKLVQNGCIICGKKPNIQKHGKRKNRIQLHEVHGKKYFSYYYTYALHLKEYDFVTLCYYHHMMVHNFIEFWKLNTEQQNKIMELVNMAL